MKIIQTYWSQNNQVLDISHRGGWLSNKANLACWALSCLNAKAIYGHIELYTDSVGYDLLIGKLQLPYDKVHIIFDSGLMKQIPKELWAISKIYTYSLQKEPFIHIDGDFIFWKKLNIDQNIIFQNRETEFPFYKDFYSYLNETIDSFTDSKFMDCVRLPYLGKACNLGIVGGRDIDFINCYANDVLDFVIKNLHMLDKFIPDAKSANCFLEQYYFYYLLNDLNIEFSTIHIDLLLEQIKGRFYDIPSEENAFNHFLGFAKKSEIVVDFVINRLHKYYPDYYNIVNKVLTGHESYEYFYFHKDNNALCLEEIKSTFLKKLTQIDLQISENLLDNFTKYWNFKLDLMNKMKSSDFNKNNIHLYSNKEVWFTQPEESLFVKLSGNCFSLGKFILPWDTVFLSDKYSTENEAIKESRIISENNIRSKPAYNLFFCTPFETSICCVWITEINAFIYQQVLTNEYLSLSEVIEKTMRLLKYKDEDARARVKSVLIEFLFNTNNYGIVEARF